MGPGLCRWPDIPQQPPPRSIITTKKIHAAIVRIAPQSNFYISLRLCAAQIAGVAKLVLDTTQVIGQSASGSSRSAQLIKTAGNHTGMAARRLRALRATDGNCAVWRKFARSLGGLPQIARKAALRTEITMSSLPQTEMERSESKRQTNLSILFIVLGFHSARHEELMVDQTSTRHLASWVLLFY